MPIVRILKWGEPKPGREFEYELALRHREGYMQLIWRTPWWQWRKRRRRWAGWSRALNRFKDAGQDIRWLGGHRVNDA